MPTDYSIEEYIRWVTEHLDVVLDDGDEERRHGVAAQKLKEQFTSSPFWKALGNRLEDWDGDFGAEHDSYHLFDAPNAEISLPEVKTKRYDSMVNKSYRKNYVENDQWPTPPISPSQEERDSAVIPEEAGDWYLPSNWLEYFTDVVRTRLVVQYMDGVTFLVKKLAELADEVGETSDIQFHSNPDGYYAAHVLISHTFIMEDRETGEQSTISGEVEIQVTTQVQILINKMLHDIYEEWRVLDQPPEGWEWDHASRAFRTNYLGPTLHYLEGMIVVARGK